MASSRAQTLVIKLLIIAKGKTQAGIAHDIGVTPATLNGVIMGTRSSEPTEKALAKRLNMKREVLFVPLDKGKEPQA